MNHQPNNSKAKIGFVYEIEHIRNGEVIDCEQVENLIPEAALNDILSVYFKSGTAKANWYLGLFKGNYTPTDAVTAANIASVSTEATEYSGSNRLAWVSGDVADGYLSNTDNRAEFTFTGTVTIYGGFLISDNTKGGALGMLASVVRFSSPKAMENGDILRVRSGITLVNA